MEWSFFGRMKRGVEILGVSWQVLRNDGKLRLLALLGVVACLLVHAAFMAPLLLRPSFAQRLFQYDAGMPPWEDPALWTFVAVWGFALVLVGTLFDAALIACALARFRGERPDLREVVGSVARLLPRFSVYAAVVIAIDRVLKFLERRVGAIGSAVTETIGLGWSAARYLVVPVMVAEDRGVYAAIGRSAELLKKSWGEALFGEFELGFVSFIAGAVGLTMIVVGVMTSPAGIPLVALGGAVVVVALMMTSALKQVFVAAVYLYANTGEIPVAFEDLAMETLFLPREAAVS